MTRNELLKSLQVLGACLDSREWVARQEAETAAECWTACKRGDWLLWLIYRSGALRAKALRPLAVAMAWAAHAPWAEIERALQRLGGS